MGVKFLFFSILLPKILPVAEFGDMSILITTITFFIFLVGLDFYNYAHRDFINDKREIIVLKLFNQLVLSFCVFFIVAPVFYWTLQYNSLPYAFLALILLYTEYFGQEIYRLLILFSKPILGNLILFFRSSLWIVALYTLSNFSNLEISIFQILLFWVLGNSILVIISMGYVICSPIINFKYLKLDFKWLKTGVIMSLPFLISTVALKIIELSDRYFINYFLSNVDVGIYSFYSNVSNSLNVFINTAVVIMIYPKILSAFKQNDNVKSVKLVKEYKRDMIVFLLFFGGLLAFLIDPIIEWVGKDIYSSEMITFWVLLTANALFNLSLIPHIILYAKHKDRMLVLPVVISCFINIIFNIIFIPLYGILGAGFSTFISFFIIAAMKYYYTTKLNSNLWRK
jgi:O-antigen/teichoic acid export membrane protein